jgi:hypothetical protein
VGAERQLHGDRRGREGWCRDLPGEVASYQEKLNAARAALRVEGVRGAANEIEIHLPGASHRSDADIARAAVASLAWNSARPQTPFVGGSPVSTGRPGAYEHFPTPLGVFPHSIDHLDFRAEGTRNEFGIRGYGVKGARVFDFGWVVGERTWGRGGLSPMRLQMHATDPDLLEPRLGAAASSGCIRISASFNQFVDKYGVLDADYEAAMERGVPFWMLRKDRTPTPWSGRYLVVVESERTRRPVWAAAAVSEQPAEESLLSSAC